MSQPEPSRLRPRFKGIENFLRRIAFNLGNSPSQTEVKIISCIPIDVTDLQNKIIELERELDQREPEPAPASHGPIVHTALVGAPRLRSATPGNNHSRPADTRASSPQPTQQSSSDSEPQSSPRLSNSHFDNLTDAPGTSRALPANGYNELNKKGSGLLQKVKKMNKKSKGRTQMVYYAQTTSNSPFQGNEEDFTGYREAERVVDETMSHEYLAGVVRRQYRPERLGPDTSLTSQFSSPVCREDPGAELPTALDSDMCSCCHGHFHNLDTARRNPGFSQPWPLPTEPTAHRNNSMYYDSSLYDVIPVKERPTKQKKDEKTCDISEERFGECDNFPKKFRTQPRRQPYVINYTATQAPHRHGRKILHKRKLPMKSVNKRDQVLRSMQKKKLDKRLSVESSRSCTIDCGNIYIKPVSTPRARKERPLMPMSPLRPTPLPKAVLLKNAECLTTSLNDTECQTATSRSVQLEPLPPEDNKTEITLNQIKSILHAVLVEVKTNSQLKTDVEDKSTKDAIVQKGQSQSNIAARSSLIDTYSYSPYNMNPYGASCSVPMTSSQLYPPPAPAPHVAPAFPPLKCLQNYPLFIQTTGRQCACCFRNIPTPVPTVTTSKGVKHAAHTTATNTDTVLEKRSKETENLIKEIYKSLAVSMDYPTKETSHSDYPELKSSDNTSQRIEFKLEPKAKPKAREIASEVVRNEVRGTSPSPLFTSKEFNGRAGSNAASFRSELVSKTTTSSSREESRRADKLRSLLVAKELQSTGSERDPPPARRRALPPAVSGGNHDTSYSDDDTETPTSEDDSDATVVNTDKPEKKEKKGLFSKMVKLFTTKRRRKKSDTTSDKEDEPASDSDDYETVYSQRSAPRPRPAPRRRPRRQVSHSRPHAPRRDPPRRYSPYMEQEYRRHWNENLTFHEGHTPRYTSERPYSREPARRYPPPAPHPYYRDYEARAALVQPAPGNQVTEQGTHAQMSPSPPTQDKVISPKTTRSASKGLAWFKKNKYGIHCGENLKRLILDG